MLSRLFWMVVAGMTPDGLRHGVEVKCERFVAKDADSQVCGCRWVGLALSCCLTTWDLRIFIGNYLFSLLTISVSSRHPSYSAYL
jgi:hypothetical protein